MSNGNTWTARRSLGALLTTALLLGSSAAHAQDGAEVAPLPPPPPPPSGASGWGPATPNPQTPGARPGPLDSRAGMVKVTLESAEPGVRVELHYRRADPENSEPILSCIDTCSTHVPRGRYKFYVVGDDSFVSGSREVDIQDDVVLVIDPDTTEHRTIGLVLGVGGIISFGVGVSLLLNGAVQANDSKAETGAWMLLGSLVAIPVGWVMFGTSFKPEWDEEYRTDREAGRKLEPRWSVGVAPVKGGGVFGASLTF